MKRPSYIYFGFFLLLLGSGIALYKTNAELQATRSRLRNQLIENDRIHKSYVAGLTIVRINAKGKTGDTLKIAAVPHIRHVSDNGFLGETATPQEIPAEMVITDQEYIMIKYPTDSIAFAADSSGIVRVGVSAWLVDLKQTTTTIERNLYFRQEGDSVSLYVGPDAGIRIINEDEMIYTPAHDE